MRPIGTRIGIAVSAIVLVTFGVALARDQLAAGVAAAGFGLLVGWVSTRPDLAEATRFHRHTAATSWRLVPMTVLTVLVMALVVSWLADGSPAGWFLGGLGVAAAAPGVGWMVDVWRVRLSSGRRPRSSPGDAALRR